MSGFEVCVAGRVAGSLVEVVRSRFGEVSTRSTGGRTTVTVGGLDAAAERALMCLLWDTGHDIVGTRSNR